MIDERKHVVQRNSEYEKDANKTCIRFIWRQENKVSKYIILVIYCKYLGGVCIKKDIFAFNQIFE